MEFTFLTRIRLRSLVLTTRATLGQKGDNVFRVKTVHVYLCNLVQLRRILCPQKSPIGFELDYSQGTSSDTKCQGQKGSSSCVFGRLLRGQHLLAAVATRYECFRLCVSTCHIDASDDNLPRLRIHYRQCGQNGFILQDSIQRMGSYSIQRPSATLHTIQ
jgi:hypothetical protein